MGFLQFVFPAKPDDWQAKTSGQTRFKINTAAMAGEISDEKFAATNSSYNFVVYLVIVLLTINSERFVSSSLNPNSDCSVSVINFFIKPHCNEPDLAGGISVAKRIQI